MLLAIGGAEDRVGTKTTSTIYGLHRDDKKWKHMGDMPFACSLVDTLLISDGGLLVVDGGSTLQVLKITVQGTYCCTGIELNQTTFRSYKTLPRHTESKGNPK